MTAADVCLRSMLDMPRRQPRPLVAAPNALGQPAPADPAQQREANVTRAVQCVDQGEIGQAMRSLQVKPMMEHTPANIAKLAATYPTRPLVAAAGAAAPGGAAGAASQMSTQPSQQHGDELEEGEQQASAEVCAQPDNEAGGQEAPVQNAPAVAVPQLTADSVRAYLQTRKKSTAGGLSGWTYADVRLLNKKLGDHACAQLVAVLQTVADGDIRDPALARRLRRLRGIALTQADGSPRPIGIGECPVQLVSGVLGRGLRDPLKESIGDNSIGCGWAAGTEALAHAVQLYLATHRAHVVIRTDIRNAFNSIARERVLAALLQLPGLAPHCQFKHGAVSVVGFSDARLARPTPIA